MIGNVFSGVGTLNALLNSNKLTTQKGEVMKKGNGKLNLQEYREVLTQKVNISDMVYESKEYDKFIPCEGQRPLSESHVKDLIKEMENESEDFSTFKRKPAICRRFINNDGEMVWKLIDGHHRKIAAQIINYPIYFTEIDENDPRTDQELMLAFNAKSKNQGLESQCRTKATTGHEGCNKVLRLEEEIKKEFGIAPGVAWIIMLSVNMTNGGGAKRYFESKKGEISLKCFKECKEFLYTIGNLKFDFDSLDKKPKKLCFDTTILKVCLELSKQYKNKWKEFVNNYSKKKFKFKNHRNIAHYLREKILNLKEIS